MRNKIQTAALTLAFALTAAPAALAADQTKPHNHTPLTFESLDGNKDGGITLAELQASGIGQKMKDHAPKAFKRMDANSDGKVTKAEFDAWQAKRKANHQEHKGNQGAKP